MINITDLERVKHYSRCIQDLKDKSAVWRLRFLKQKKMVISTYFLVCKEKL